MNIGDEHPIDPLPEPSWERIKEGVFAELDSDQGESARSRERRGRWPVVVAGLSAAAIAAAAALFFVSPDVMEPGTLESTRIATANAATETTIGDVSILVEPHSALVAVENDAVGWLVVLEQGAAVFAVPPRAGRPPFIVQSGHTRVEVVGTRFRVERVGGSAEVDVYEGTVRVVAEDRTALLERGDHWPTSPATSGSEPASSTADVEPDFEGVEGSETRSDSIHQSQDHSESLARDVLRHEFERAASQEASDPGEAIRIYRSLARRGGPWAANALYALGRLELERGNRSSAERHLRLYLDRFPRGANAEDARELLERNQPRGESR